MYSCSSLIGLVSSKRKWQRPPNSWAIPKLSAIALGWPRWRYPFGSGGKRVTTYETLPSRKSGATVRPRDSALARVAGEDLADEIASFGRGRSAGAVARHLDQSSAVHRHVWRSRCTHAQVTTSPHTRKPPASSGRRAASHALMNSSDLASLCLQSSLTTPHGIWQVKTKLPHRVAETGHPRRRFWCNRIYGRRVILSEKLTTLS